MIFVTHFNSSKQAKDYLSQHLSKGDYYTQDAERLTPTFEGRLAQRLGLEGQKVTAESFGSLIDNVHPVTGEKLTVRTKEARRSMSDLTFDGPKDVSLVWLKDERVADAFDRSVDMTMRMIEEEAQTRVRKGGKDEDRVTGELLWTSWAHETTRPLADGTVDPFLHRHVTVLNMTHDPVEDRLKAVQLGGVVKDVGYWRAVHNSFLSDELQKLGYSTIKEGNSFRIEGLPKELREKFSRRTALIEKVAADRGITDEAQKAKLGRKTRNRKGEELSTDALHEEWLGRMTPVEVKALRDARNGSGHQSASLTPDESVQYAIDHTFVKESTVPERKLQAEALRYGVGSSVLPDEIRAAVERHPDLIRVQRDGRMMVTTRQMLEREIEMLKLARDGHGQAKPFTVDDAALTHLDAEGQKAARTVLKSRDWVVGLQGGAGTGKTTLLKTVRSAIEKESSVFAFAQSASASRGTLKEAGFENATTLAALFLSEQRQRDLRGNVLLVDESSLNGTQDTARVLEIAKANGARKVMFVGDQKQHHSVAAGDAFRLLRQEAGVRFAELTTIRRQKVEGYRKAVEAISEGKIQKGFDLLDKQKAIVEAGPERHKLLVDDYLQAVKEGKSALIISPTHKEADALTSELRDALKAHGTLGTREHQVVIRKGTGWTEPEKGDWRNYEPGMVLEFNEAVSGQRVRKDGQRATIGGIAKGSSAVVTEVAGGQVTLLKQDGTEVYLPKQTKRFEVYRIEKIGVSKGERLRMTKNGSVGSKTISNGDMRIVEGFTQDLKGMKLDDGTILPTTYGHFTRGYVDTSYASQGKNVDRVFITAGSVLAVNSQGWYVAVSRGKEAAKVYVEDKKEFRKAVERPGKRLSAVELVGYSGEHPAPKAGGQKMHSFRERMNEMLERNRVLSYVREKTAAVREWHQRRQEVVSRA